MNLNQDQLNRVMSYLRKKEQPHNRHYLTRVTLLKNHKILAEYDFFLKRTLTRNEALSRRIEAETNARIRNHLSKKIEEKSINQYKQSVDNPLKALIIKIKKLIKY
jgi:hypothetical protein